MRRLLFWAVVALTVAAVAFGVWYYVRDDYPFQVSAGQITGLTYEAIGPVGTASGVVPSPPADLADWLSTMESESGDQPVTIVGVALIHLSDGRALRLELDVSGRTGLGQWISPGGVRSESARVHVGQDLSWYLRGVGDGLGPAASPAASATSSSSPTASASAVAPTSPVPASPTVTASP